MPMPTPNKGEPQDKFMNRCMTMLHDENMHKDPKNQRPQKQMIAMCFSQWRNGTAALEAGAAGKGSALKVNRTKLSEEGWGNVDKTSLRNKILAASNASSLVHDVYLLVEAGWESAPSEHLKYPVMDFEGDTLYYNRGGLAAALQRAEAQNETGVVSKIHGLYKKLKITPSTKTPNKKTDGK